MIKCKKSTFTEAAAKETLRIIQKKSTRGSILQRVYHCDICGLYHLTSMINYEEEALMKVIANKQLKITMLIRQIEKLKTKNKNILYMYDGVQKSYNELKEKVEKLKRYNIL